MCHKILKSCCLGLVEFIHKDYNTLELTLRHRRHKPYTALLGFSCSFQNDISTKIRLCNKSIKCFIHSFIHYPFLFSFVVEECVIYF